MQNRKINNTPRKANILKLRAEGKSYREIEKILGCSKSTIAYHCDGGKEKNRIKNNLKKRKPICRKVSSFRVRCARSNHNDIRKKLKTFKRKGNRARTPIDIEKPNTYHLDHIIPTSKGGTNDINNLGLCLKEANYAKGELSIDELYQLCENILAWRDKNT